MEIIGYIASIAIGVSLGLIGGGGSILTVPVLVYLFHQDATVATGYSLFIVGFTSAVGSFQYFKKGLVNTKTAIVFGIPSIIAVFLTRALIVPAIPSILWQGEHFTLTKSIFLLILFACLMVSAAYSMLKPSSSNSDKAETEPQSFNYPMIILEGFVVGTLTGLVGAGGGFLIIPALVMLSKLPMKEAIGTSLVIIAAKSLIGFLGEQNIAGVDWTFLLTITTFAVIGIFIGTMLSKKIEGNKLKPAFGWFVMVMGIYIIAKELFFK